MKRVGLFLTLLTFCFAIIAQSINDDNQEQIKKGQFLEYKANQRSYQSSSKVNSKVRMKSASNSKQAFYNIDFGSSIGKWSMEGQWQQGYAAVGPAVTCVGTNLTGAYNDGADYRLVSPDIMLPSINSLHGQIELAIEEWFITESSFDKGYVEVSTDGGNSWTVLNQRSGNSNGWIDNLVLLTAYEGQTVKLAFHMTSNQSINNSGWYIRNAELVTFDPKLEANIAGINYNKESEYSPLFTYLNVEVDSLGQSLGTLDERNFKIYEDNILQENYYKVTPPSEGSGVRLADIVFIVDNSGSFSSYQNAVRNNMISFVDKLKLSGVDFSLGLCRFGQSSLSGNPIIEEGGILTSNAENFKNNIWSRNLVNGGTEPAYDAIVSSISNFGFRKGAQKIIIILADENPDQGLKTKLDAITAANSASARVYSLTTSSSAALNDVSTQTKGRFYNIYDPFNDILNDIVSSVSNSYVLTYMPSNQILNGVERQVRVEVETNSGLKDLASGSYTPGSSPSISRTESTIDLEKKSWQQNTGFSIEAKVSDRIAPFVQTVTLFYKNSELESYSQVSMTNLKDTTWVANIPSNTVLKPGVDYYIVASDGVSTSTLPTTDPAVNPFQIGILPNIKPVIKHNVISRKFSIGDTQVFDADITDNTNKLDSVAFFYRNVGDLVFKAEKMTLSGSSSYSFELKIEKEHLGGIEYYISAWDDFGIGTSTGLILSGAKFGGCSSPDWEPVSYAKSTRLKGKVNLGAKGEPAEEGDMVAAFVDGECRAVCEVFTLDGVAYMDLDIQGFGPQDVEIKAWDASECIVHDNVYKQRMFLGWLEEFPELDIEVISAAVGGTDVQRLELSKGLNLVSLYVSPEDNNPESIFGKSDRILMVRDLTKVYLPARPGLKTLMAIEDGKGYYVLASSDEVIEVEGEVLDVNNVVVNLDKGNNIIGCPLTSPISVSVAMSEMEAANKLLLVKDLKTQYNPLQSYTLNTLKQLEPGKGYIVSVSGSFAYRFPYIIANSSIAHKSASVKPEVWSFEAKPNSMVYTSELLLDGFNIESNAVLGAFIDGVCRGEYEVLNDDGKSFGSLVINGEEEAEITFKLFVDGKTFVADRSIEFKPGEMVSSDEVLRFSSTSLDLDVVNVSSFDVYPTVVKNTVNISLTANEQMSCKISITDISGKVRVVNNSEHKLLAGQNNIALDLNLSSGVYILNVQLDNGGVLKRKIILRK